MPINTQGRRSRNKIIAFFLFVMNETPEERELMKVLLDF